MGVHMMAALTSRSDDLLGLLPYVGPSSNLMSQHIASRDEVDIVVLDEA